jgi:hypothetical protein
MSQRILVAAFADERDLLHAVAAVRQRSWPVLEAYTPYPVHGLEEMLGLRRTRLAAACLFFGVLGVSLALAFQFWATAESWPLNVGGQPWNSLPAFVPVTFEAMVLFAGLGVVLAWLVRCRLFPGKTPGLPAPGITDNRFVLVVGVSDTVADRQAARNLLQENQAVSLDEREE